MTAVVKVAGGPLSVERVIDFKINSAKADAVITFAAKVKDWPLLEDAVDQKIADQVEFVRWWDESVRPNYRPTETVSDLQQLTATEAEERTDVTKVQVSRWRKRLRDAPKYRDALILAARRKAELVSAENHRAEGTGENEWFTPALYVDAARVVMGGIDLDPATHPVAQEVIRAERYFTRVEDGLTKEWHGRVWLNPPYERALIGRFVEKLIVEISIGRVEQAVLLTHNYTDTQWFHAAESLASLLCFTRGRIGFVDIDGDPCAPTQGQAFFYYGNEHEKFREVFTQFGFVR